MGHVFDLLEGIEVFFTEIIVSRHIFTLELTQLIS